MAIGSRCKAIAALVLVPYIVVLFGEDILGNTVAYEAKFYLAIINFYQMDRTCVYRETCYTL